MGALALRSPGQYKDDIDIVTTKIQEEKDGIEKTSHVDITAVHTSPGSYLWIGLKIDKRQKVIGLSVDGKIWVGARTSMVAAAIEQFDRLMPTGEGEQWATYKVIQSNLPHAFKFETKLKLNRRVASFPDAQTVVIAVCYAPEDGKPLERKNILVGHSIVPSPRPSASRAKKRD
jgi:hypothetical protein